jgi:hypothetical protein
MEELHLSTLSNHTQYKNWVNDVISGTFTGKKSGVHQGKLSYAAYLMRDVLIIKISNLYVVADECKRQVYNSGSIDLPPTDDNKLIGGLVNDSQSQHVVVYRSLGLNIPEGNEMYESLPFSTSWSGKFCSEWSCGSSIIKIKIPIKYCGSIICCSYHPSRNVDSNFPKEISLPNQKEVILMPGSLHFGKMSTIDGINVQDVEYTPTDKDISLNYFNNADNYQQPDKLERASSLGSVSINDARKLAEYICQLKAEVILKGINADHDTDEYTSYTQFFHDYFYNSLQNNEPEYTTRINSFRWIFANLQERGDKPFNTIPQTLQSPLDADRITHVHVYINQANLEGIAAKYLVSDTEIILHDSIICPSPFRANSSPLNEYQYKVLVPSNALDANFMFTASTETSIGIKVPTFLLGTPDLIVIQGGYFDTDSGGVPKYVLVEGLNWDDIYAKYVGSSI